MWYGLNMTCCSYYTFTSMHVHVRLMMSNLSFKTLMYVRTRRVHDSLQTDVCLSGTHMPNLDYAHANCKPRTAELLYQNVHAATKVGFPSCYKT